MPVVSHTLTQPAGEPIANAVVYVRLLATATAPNESEGFVASNQTGILSERKILTDSTGKWTITLTANALITPANTTYQVIQPGANGSKVVETFIVPNAAGPFWLGDILAAAPVGLPQYGLDVHDASTTAHAGILARLPVLADGTIYVSATSGNDTNDGLSPGSAKATIEAAKTTMGTTRRGVIELGLGTHNITGTLSFSGYRCSMKGLGPGSIVQAVAQTGPVVDLKGWLHPGFEQIQEWGNFKIRGDGTTGTAKKGLRCGETGTPGIGGTVFRDISVENTGGTPFDYSGAQICTFENMVAVKPVGDVPYHYGQGPTNGNHFVGMGLRSASTAADNTNCVLFEDDGTYAPLLNVFTAPWFEFLHLPTDGALFHLKGSNNSIIEPLWFDNAKMTGATGTCGVRFSAPTVENFGANRFTGVILGTQGGTSLDRGIVISQSGNVIEGAKAFNGSNVELTTGVERTYAILKGAEAAASAAGFIDNSGMTTNVLIDTYGGTWELIKGIMKLVGELRVGGRLSLTATGVPLFFGVVGSFAKFQVSEIGTQSWGSGSAATDVQLQREAANRLRVNLADFELGTVGRGLRVKEGTNAKQGTATLVSGTATVANTSVTANSRIFLAGQDNNVAGALRVSARTAGTSFTITSSVGTDSGVVAYEIFEPSP